MDFEGIRETHRDALRLLATVVDQGPGGAAVPQLVDLLVRHFRTEEEELIPRVADHLPSGTGPVHVVLTEHEEIRAILADLSENPSATALERLAGLLPSHFAKEEELLLPFAEARLDAPPAFDSLADLYDLLVDWERRLPREIAFLHDVLSRNDVRSVLDAACGTGAHLAELAARGYEVSGADISEEMVEHARRRCGPGTRVKTVDFSRVHEAFAPHDAVMVVGNSLPNVGTEEGVRAALAGLAEAVAQNGILLLHMLNYAKLVREGGGERPVRRVASGGREYVFTKVFEVHPGAVKLTVTAETDGETRRTESVLWPVLLPWLEGELTHLGLRVTDATGGFLEEPYDEETSGDLLVVASKKEPRP
jgi:SAM-dependent methyltransferase